MRAASPRPPADDVRGASEHDTPAAMTVELLRWSAQRGPICARRARFERWRSADVAPLLLGVHVTDRMTDQPFTKSEMMIVAAARELAGQRVCFVGVGLPNIAVNLAKRTVAPDLELVYEAGVFGARPARLPLSIGDPTIVTGATAVDQHVRAVRVLPPGRADRRRVPGRGPDRPVRQHQHDRHRRLRAPDDPAPGSAAARARSRSTPARCS